MAPWHEFWSGGFWIFPIIMMTFMLVIVIVVLFMMRSFLGRNTHSTRADDEHM